MARLGNSASDDAKREEHHFKMFESLPPLIRYELATAPYQFAIEEIYDRCNELYAAGMSQDEVVQTIVPRLRQMMERVTQREVLNNYGDQHPQAGEKWDTNLKPKLRRLNKPSR